MTTYSIFEREGPDREPVAVAEKFSWFAALLPPVFALRHGMWVRFALYLLVVLALSAASLWIGEAAAVWLYLLFAVWIGLEAPGFQRRRLTRGGWSYRSEIIAPGADLAAVEWLKRNP
jgi:Protein of unknown function (DUF2628)